MKLDLDIAELEELQIALCRRIVLLFKARNKGLNGCGVLQGSRRRRVRTAVDLLRKLRAVACVEPDARSAAENRDAVVIVPGCRAWKHRKNQTTV